MNIRRIIAMLGLCLVGAPCVLAQDNPPTTRAAVIEPEVERRDIDVSDIDTEDFELGAHVGLMSVEDFGVNTALGLRFAYHITERFFVETAYAQTETEKTSFERLSGAAELLTPEERDLTYYNLSFGWNVLPGESFVGRRRAFNTGFYLIGGVGSTEFAGDDRFTVNVGMGMRLLLTDWLAMHVDVRDHMYDIDLLGQEKTSHNIESKLSLTFFF